MGGGRVRQHQSKIILPDVRLTHKHVPLDHLLKSDHYHAHFEKCLGKVFGGYNLVEEFFKPHLIWSTGYVDFSHINKNYHPPYCGWKL